MANPNTIDNGQLRPMTDAEAAEHFALQDSIATALTSTDGLLAYAAQVRYAYENKGVTCTVNGQSVPVSTARGNDRTMMVAEFSMLGAGIRTDGEPFKFDDGISRNVTNSEMQAICGAALLHVKSAFSIESLLQAGINATPPTITTRDQIDQAFAG